MQIDWILLIATFFFIIVLLLVRSKIENLFEPYIISRLNCFSLYILISFILTYHINIWLRIMLPQLNATLILYWWNLKFRHQICIFFADNRLVAIIFLSRSWSQRYWVALESSVEVLCLYDLIIMYWGVEKANRLIIRIFIVTLFLLIFFNIAIMTLLLGTASIFLFRIEIFGLADLLLVFYSAFTVILCPSIFRFED